MTYEELKQAFIDNGFQVDGDKFIKKWIDTDTSFIFNGMPQKREMKFEMEYIGEGCSWDDGSSDETPLFMFEMPDGSGLGIETYDDFTKMVKLK